MNYFDLNLPPGCKVIGRLYWDQDVRNLSEDMVDIIIGDFLISAGYYDTVYRIDVSLTNELTRLFSEETPYAKILIEGIANTVFKNAKL